MKHSIKNPVFLLWALYTCFIFYGTLIPFDLNFDSLKEMSSLKQLFPSKIGETDISKMDIISNYLLFIPWGALLAALIRPLNWGLNLIFVLVLSFLLSFCVEILQIFSPSRSSSFGDVLINTLSGITGWFISFIFFKWIYFIVREPIKELMHEKPLLFITLLVGLGTLLGSLFPFDISIQVSDLKQAIKGIHWIPFGSFQDPNFFASLSKDMILFAVFAGFCHFSIRLYCTSLNHFFLPTLFLTAALSLSIEGAQLFIRGRTTDSSDLIMAIIGGIIGCTISLVVEKAILRNSLKNREESLSPSQTYFWLSFIYALFVIYFLISPLQFELTWQSFQSKWTLTMLVPFYAYWIHTDFYALQDWVVTICLYIPFGALLFSALKSLNIARFVTLVLGIALSCFIEFVQFFQPNRYPDITDVLAGILGTYVGIWMIRKLISQEKES